MSRDTFHQTRLLRAPSSLAWNTSREGAVTASLGSLFQCLTTFTVKNVFLVSSLPSFSLNPLPLVLSLHTVFLVGRLQVLQDHNKVPPDSSLLQAEQPYLSQLFLTPEVLQPSDHFYGLLWLQQLHAFPVLRGPELDTVLQVDCHQSIAVGQNHLP